MIYYIQAEKMKMVQSKMCSHFCAFSSMANLINFSAQKE